MKFGWQRKVKIVDQAIQKTPVDLFKSNKKDLGFIPSLFFVILIICLAIFGVWYFKPFESNTATPSVLSALENKNVFQTQSQSINTDKNTAKDTSSAKIQPLKIYNGTKVECALNFQINKPDNLESIVTDSLEGWWLPQTNCEDRNLIALQIIKLPTLQGQNLQTKLNFNNLQLLDEENSIYTIVYTKNQTQSRFAFSRYLKYLAEPVFSDKVYLASEDIWDSKYYGNYTYYLTGGCKGKSPKYCNLWRTDNFSGDVELLTQKVAQTFAGQKNELQDYQTIKFAKNQDVKDALNLTIINTSSQYPEFKLISLDNSSWNIIQSLDIYPAQKAYFDYFR